MIEFKKKKIKLGLIGLGFVSQVVHIPTLIKNKNVQIECIVDNNKSLLNKVAKKNQIKKKYTSYKDMANKEVLDGVLVCVQRKKTFKIVKFFLKKKIPVLSEKPAALNFKNAKTLVNLSKKFQCKYFLGYMKVHEEGVKLTKKILDNKQLGELQFLNYKNLSGTSYIGKHNYFKQTKNYIKKFSLNKKNLSTKNNFIKFLNSNCHSINLLRFFFDKIHLDKNYLNNQGEGILVFKDKNKIISFTNIYSNIKNKWIEHLKFYFTKGVLDLRLPPPLTRKRIASVTILTYKNGKKKKIFLKNKDAFSNQLNAFLEYINKKNYQHHCLGSNCLEDFKIIQKLF